MQIELDLANPNFTLLHRAGVAGLWMTLQQLTKEKVNPPEGLIWELTSRKVILSASGSDQIALEWLLKESFQLRDGLIALRGINAKTMRKDALAIVHKGILGTFLQHNSTHKSTGVKTESFSLGEDGQEILVNYKVLTSYVYQDFAKNLCDQKGKFLSKSIPVAGWLNPGAVVRHIAFSAHTSFEEFPESALALLFAPVACYYYILRSKLRDKRAQYALVIPEVINLEKFAAYKQDIHQRYASYQDFNATSLGDAGLRFLTYETTAKTANLFEIPRCQVVTLGTVAWSTQQKTRTDLYLVEADAKICHNYQICRDEMCDRIVVNQKGQTFISPSFARELIAENLARGQAWYAGISEQVNSQDLFKMLTYERGGLYQMIQKVEWSEKERLFVQACHEALYYTYGKLADQKSQSSELPNFDKVNTKIRTGLSRCKNAETFREFIVDFWSRAGQIPTLKAHWEDLMDLIMSEKYWKKSRDLTLLALASYKGKGVSKPEKEDKDDDDSEDQGGIEFPWG